MGKNARFIVRAAGVDLGSIAEGPSSVQIQVGIGEDQRAVRVRMARKETRYIY